MKNSCVGVTLDQISQIASNMISVFPVKCQLNIYEPLIGLISRGKVVVTGSNEEKTLDSFQRSLKNIDSKDFDPKNWRLSFKESMSYQEQTSRIFGDILSVDADLPDKALIEHWLRIALEILRDNDWMRNTPEIFGKLSKKTRDFVKEYHAADANSFMPLPLSFDEILETGHEFIALMNAADKFNNDFERDYRSDYFSHGLVIDCVNGYITIHPEWTTRNRGRNEIFHAHSINVDADDLLDKYRLEEAVNKAIDAQDSVEDPGLAMRS